MASLLFEVSPVEPATYVAVSLGLVAAVLIATYVPARRATGVDPLIALRCE
jgi:putative ABC transport system permease protein